jgi:hypothetical protein
MQADQKPALVTLPFAANGLGNANPERSQTGITAGAASLNDGFPPLTMQPKTQGGVPPDGKDFNGILFLLSVAARWMHAGGSFIFDPAFPNNPNLGGYPRAQWCCVRTRAGSGSTRPTTTRPTPTRKTAVRVTGSH